MAVDSVFKIAAVGLIVAVINSLLKSAGKDDIAMLTTIAGVIIVLGMVIDMIYTLFENVRSVFMLW